MARGRAHGGPAPAFENEKDTQLVAAFLGDITGILATDGLDGARAMLWSDQQRGIGELMMSVPEGARSLVLNHASFHRKYDKVFADWMGPFSKDLLTQQAGLRRQPAALELGSVGTGQGPR